MRRTRTENKSKKIVVYFIGLIMVFSAFGVVFFGFGGGVNTFSDRGLKFVDKGNYLSTKINGQEGIFNYLPSNVEVISVDDGIINRLRDAIEIDITSDFNDTFAEEIALAQFQMDLTLNNAGRYIRGGFASENPYNYDIITCGGSSSFVPVIYFRKANETNVYLEDNCIIAEARINTDILAIKDRLVYGILGVIE